MVPIQTTLVRILNGDSIFIAVFVFKCTPTALQASTGMKTSASATALHVVAQSASTGLAISACVNATLSLVNQVLTSLSLDANAFYIPKTATLQQTSNLILH